MATSNELSTILERIAEGCQTEEDMLALRQLLSASSSQNVLQLGKYNVNIAQGQEIHIGDHLYESVDTEAIKDILLTTLQSLNSGSSEIGIPENLPRSSVKYFAGREQELKILYEQLQQNERVTITAITGMGGVGKTELALQYALQYKQEYLGGICWIQARGIDIGSQILWFARSQLQLNPPEELDLPDQVNFCWAHWPPGKVLMILDDVQDYEAIKLYLPLAETRFKIIITSRLKLDESALQFEITLLDEASALALLGSLVGKERIQKELENAKILCAWLGHLPLGLELIGRYLSQKPDLSLAEMQQRLESNRLGATALKNPGADMTNSLNIAASLELSWSTLNESAKKLCFLLSLFAWDGILWSLVEEAVLDKKPEDLEENRDYLRNLHLLQRSGERTYQLHPLIRDFFKSKLESSGWAEELKQSVCRIIANVSRQIPQSPTTELVRAIAPAMPHLAEVATVLKDWLKDEDLIWPFIGLGRFYEGQGLYPQAVTWTEQCLSVAHNRFGDNHPAIAVSLNNLAGLYKTLGRYSEAELLYVQALELTRCLLGEEHPDVASSLNNLAGLYYLQGRYSEAELLHLRAIELIKRLLGEEHAAVATSLNNLAELYYSQGRYAEAEPLYAQALELIRRLLGEEHPDVASSLNNLAGLYTAQGRYAEAEPLYLQALEIYRCVFGAEHPIVATSLNNLGSLYEAQGRYAEAEPLYTRALELSRHLLGEDHPDVATSLNNLAGLYEAQGRYAEAEPLYTQALKLSRRLLGEDHPDVATSLNNLASLYYSQGHYAEAEPLYLQALKIYKRVLGENHPTFATSLNNLAGLYKSLGRYSEAEPLYAEALDLRKQLLGEDHPAVASSLNSLGKLYYSQGRYAEAEPLLVEELKITSKVLGNGHPDILVSLNNLGMLYLAQGRSSEAKKIFEQGLASSRSLLGESHPLSVKLQQNLEAVQ